MTIRFPRSLLALALVAAVTSTAAPGVGAAGDTTDSSVLRAAVTIDGMMEHEARLQRIADANGGTRSSGTPGYDQSAAYVADTLRAAGYRVTMQPFSYDSFVLEAPAVLEQVAPNPTSYVELTDHAVMDYSGAGDVTAPVTAVDVVIPSPGGSSSGCEADDFMGFPAGDIALMQRGTCSFRTKVDNAAAAGAVGAIIFNEGDSPDREDLLFGTLSAPQAAIPAVGTTYALGVDLASTSDLVVHLAVEASTTSTDTVNVLADSPKGRPDRIIVVGAHLDSVDEGPGINDNGSGVSAILEIAEQMTELGITHRNMVRFAFWGGEEDGLIGSTHYVDNLPDEGIRRTFVNLNFDMLGSPNYVRFVYDGDGSDTGTAGPMGSDIVEDVFNDYFASQGLATEPTAFDGRSDYGPFIAVGIPAGGLFSGAEGIKTVEEAHTYGGVAGEPYDHCYHLACDTLGNVNRMGLGQLADGAAHAVLTFAREVSAMPRAAQAAVAAQEFQGSHRMR